MKYQYKGFIPQQIAPKDAKNIGVYDSNGNKICSIPLGRLTPPTAGKLYSVGVISDTHFEGTTVNWNPTNKFNKALSYFETEGCLFCCHSGDMTQNGFFRGSAPTTMNTSQFTEYKQVCDSHTIPVYEICGNHESYTNPISNNLTDLQQYVSNPLYYSVTQGNDVYIFIGQPDESIPMSDEALQWLYETLETNRNERCFIFVHPYISDDSGNPLESYGNPIFDWWGTKTTAFKNLLKHYKNTVLFHGHSHMMWECQELDNEANYTEKNGFRSIHIPSLCRPANIEGGTRTYQDSKSYGCLMDVYSDCIVLNGMDFINDEPVPTGTFKIYTPLVNITAGTFTDSTGHIAV